HISPAPRTALSYLTEGLIVDAEEAHWPGGLPGAAFDQRSLWAQTREGEPITAAGLLNQSSVPKRLENAAFAAAHVVIYLHDEAAGQLAQRVSGPGEGRAIGEKFQISQYVVVAAGRLDDILVKFSLGHGDMISHAPEHFLLVLNGLAIFPPPQVALLQHCAGV